MEPQQKFESIFSQKINKKNISIVRKFFVPEKSSMISSNAHNQSNQPYNKVPIINRNHKSKKQFTAGFYGQNGSKQIDATQDIEKIDSMIIQSKKAPNTELRSFLLGISQRIKKSAEQQQGASGQKQKYYSNFITKRKLVNNQNQNIDQVINNLKRLKISIKAEKQSSLSTIQKSPRKMDSEQFKEYQISTIQSPSKMSDYGSKINSPYITSSKTIAVDQYQMKLPIVQQKKCIQANNLQKSIKQSSKIKASSNDKTKLTSHRIILSETKTPTLNPTNRIHLKKKVSHQFFKVSNQTPLALKKGYLFYDDKANEIINNQPQKVIQFQIKDNISEGKMTTSTTTRQNKNKNKIKYVKNITAANYIVIDRNTLEIIAEKRSDEFIQIASLTKIMTCYLCLLTCIKYKVDAKLYTIRVSDRAGTMPGTSAQLQAGDIISLYNLLYGLMLPSGNDASVAIAQATGKIIQKYRKKPSKKSYYDTFIGHMNLFAKELGIQQSYQNPSGLSFNPNFSTPRGLSLLTVLAMQNQTFCQIINCKQHTIDIKNQRFGLMRSQTWVNTNKLLWKGFQGVKTGTTQTAGHCLMSCRNNLLISVYNCETLGKRFTECSALYKQFSTKKTQIIQ